MLVLWVKLSTGQPTLESRVFRTEAECQVATGRLIVDVHKDGDLFIINAGCFGMIPVEDAKT